MKKIIILLILSVLIVGCGNDKIDEADTATPAEPVVELTAVDYRQMFESVLPYRCTGTVVQEEQDLTGQATVYFKNKKQRMDISLQNPADPSQTVISHSIYDEEFVHQWVELPGVEENPLASLTNIKINIAEMKAMAAEMGEDVGDVQAPEQLAEVGRGISCEQTTVDDSIFDPPADIEFTDFTELMRGLSDSQ